MIDPLTASAITVTGKWLWDEYGSKIIDLAAKDVKERRDEKALQKAWEAGTKTYFTKLYKQVNWLFVLGKQEGILLEHLYTDVTVFESKLSAEQRYSLENMEEAFGSLAREQWRWRKDERKDGLAVAKKHERLFILGKPGAGKTTFLKHLALEALNRRIEKSVPIFVTLKELADSEMEIVPFIAAQFSRCNVPQAEAFVRDLLKDGRGLVLLDGLDEVNVADEERSRLITHLHAFMDEFDQNKFCVTCRLAAMDSTFPRFTYAEMADFSPEQQKEFVFRWFQNDLPKRNRCWQALEDSKSETLRELAQVPILLSLLCLNFEERGEFPDERSELYEEATRALLQKWDSKRNIARDKMYHDLSVRQRERLLAQVAAGTFEKGEYFIPMKRLVALIEDYLRTLPGIQEPDGEAVLKAIAAQHGLLVERARGIYSFSHLTLQEYFTALYIVQNEARGTLPRLMRHVGDNRWREVFLLVVGMLAEAKAFADEYLAGVKQIVSEDTEVVTLLGWATEKASVWQGTMSHHSRAFYLALVALDSADAITISHLSSVGLDRFGTLTFTLANRLALAGALSCAGKSISVSINIGAPDKAPFVSISSEALDKTHHSILNHTRFRTLDPVYVSAFDQSFISSLTLDSSLFVWLIFCKTIQHDLQLKVDLPMAFAEGPSNLTVLSQGLGLATLTEKMADLPWPQEGASGTEVKQFGQALQVLAICERNVGHDWYLSEEQWELLATYLEANQLLVECLQGAVLPQTDREAVEARILQYP